MSYEQAFHDGETTGWAEERRAVVAWLRDEAKRLGASNDAEVYVYGPPFMNRAADGIERGEHHKAMQPEGTGGPRWSGPTTSSTRCACSASP